MLAKIKRASCFAYGTFIEHGVRCLALHDHMTSKIKVMCIIVLHEHDESKFRKMLQAFVTELHTKHNRFYIYFNATCYRKGCTAKLVCGFVSQCTCITSKTHFL